MIEHFGINVNSYDLIKGYRADDSYFDFAEAFLNNSITVEQLYRAMQLGKLGEQIVLKSQFAFSKIKYEGFEIAEKELFYVLRKARNDEANRAYVDIQDEESDGLFIQRNKDINKASADTLYRISKALGCKIEDLIEK